ncbi:MAG: class C sortase [Oscillospiraceae bacterium]|nr:class C sortase [Oscillospiraceae bacterium]
MKRKKKNKGTDVLLILIFLAGLSLLLYPVVSNFWNARVQSNAIADYAQAVDNSDRTQAEQMLAAARSYNDSLLSRDGTVDMDETWQAEYSELLNVAGTGIMGYVDVPCINCKLPIYHGTDESVLQVAVGHLEWTSLPVGGSSTHAVISGHRGLPSAELLTHIDRLETGDRFYIHVLGEALEYRVDDIAVVLPNDTSRLRVVAGEDYVTLVTCTPYGINSHRLLVRGTRVQNSAGATSEQLYLTNELRPVSLVYVIPLTLVGLGAITGLFLGVRSILSRKWQRKTGN